MERLEERIALYAQPIHSSLAGESYAVFEDQFGTTAMTQYVTFFREGAFEEDAKNNADSPFGPQSGLNHPSLRHFWNRDSPTDRDWTDGYLLYDSAPNRAIKYLTGGLGLADNEMTRVFDNGSVRSNGWVSPRGEGAAFHFSQMTAAGFSTAFRYLGHAAHLLQDMGVPAHAHNDPHLDRPLFGIVPQFQDPDPYHDFVDGAAFNKNGVIPNVADEAFFDLDENRDRWKQFGTRSSVSSNKLQSVYDVMPGFIGGVDVPDLDPFVRLYRDAVNFTDDYDSKDGTGDVDNGTRAGGGPLFSPFKYDNWTEAEIREVANDLVPRTIKGTAELIRYFFGVVDIGTTGDPDAGNPFVDLPKFTSNDPAKPQVVSDPRITLLAVATDQDNGDSGVGKDLFKFEFAEANSSGNFPPVWTELIQGGFGDHFDDGQAYGDEFNGKHGADSIAVFTGEDGKTYRFRVTAEDGAGNQGMSEEFYVRVGDPEVSVVTVLDVSGSMRGSPLGSAKIAAQDFVGLLDDFSDIGVVSFNSSAAVRLPLTEITPGSTVREQAQGAIGGLSAGGSTSIGAGLLAAYSQLAIAPIDQDSVRQIIVLSDGQENTAPFVRDVLNNADPSIAVFGIALGSGADTQQLQEITNERMGEFFAVPDMASLGPVFARLSGVINDEQGVLNNSGSLTNGQTSESTFIVDPQADQLTAGLQWPGSDFDLTVISPTGVVYSEAQLPGGARFIGTATSEFIKIDNPESGEWRAIVRAIDVDPSGEAFDLLARVVSPVKGRILPGPDVIGVGETLNLQVLLSLGAGIPGAAVSGTFVSQADRVETAVDFFDDGLHNDGIANDGVYGGSVLAGTSGAGAYELRVDAEGTLPAGGDFVRTPSRVFFVSGSGVAGGSIGGYVYVDVNNNGVFDASELPLPNVTIRLSGQVDRIAVTNIEGFYGFTSLPAGDYNVSEEQPLIFLDGIDSLGTPALGTVGDDSFESVTIGPGVLALDYNFGERGLLPEMISKRLLLNNPPALSVIGSDYVVSVDTNVIPFRPSAATNVLQAAVTQSVAGVQVYDANLMPVSFAIDQQRLALPLEADQPYLLVTRLVSGSANAQLAIVGSDGNDLTALGDYDWNGVVDDSDLLVWRHFYGSSSNLSADGNGDGIVNAADYATWRNHQGTISIAESTSFTSATSSSILSVAAPSAISSEVSENIANEPIDMKISAGLLPISALKSRYVTLRLNGGGTSTKAPESNRQAALLLLNEQSSSSKKYEPLGDVRLMSNEPESEAVDEVFALFFGEPLGLFD